VVFAPVNPNSVTDWRGRTVAISAAAALTIATVALVGLDPSAPCALPALVLPALIVLRRYPGERMLATLSRVPREPRRRERSSLPFAGRATVAVARGGLLLACSLAVRPPPSTSLAAS
jgi:hypothetical protein